MNYSLALLLSFLILTPKALATEVSSPNYKLEIGDFNITSGKKPAKNQSEQANTTPAPNIYPESGYIMKTGYPSGIADETFGFSIEPNLVKFSPLYPDQPLSQDVALTVRVPKNGGYQILAQANDLLKNSSNDIINQVRCDDPIDPCNPSHAGFWNSPLTHGYGFTVLGEDSLEDFDHAKRFRPFALLSKGEGGIQIAASLRRTLGKRISTLRLKINTPEDQPTGLYQNTLQLVAMPSF